MKSVYSSRCNYYLGDTIGHLGNLGNLGNLGLDKISGKLIRYGEPEISGPLAFILNQSLKQGKFPTGWKNAKVVPIFKSGAVNDKNNYRPISILTVLSKVLERFVHMHFSTFLEENNLITLVQSGFRHMYSTLTSLINITDRWLRNIDQGLVTSIIFIDL